MDRKTERYAIIGVLLAALGCIGSWLALPQMRQLADPLLANPLFWPLVAIIVVFALLLPFIDLRALAARLRSFLPGHKPERAYLTAIYETLNRTPALLVLGGRDEAYRELEILKTFSALTLRPEDSAAESSADALDDQLIEALRAATPRYLFQRSGWIARATHTPTERLNYAVFSSLAQLALLALAIALCFWLLWSPQAGWQLTWPRTGGALLIAIVWLLGANWLHRSLPPAARRRWALRRSCTAKPGTPGAQIWRHPRLLIRGDPGSGKTTLLRHIAVVCASERLGLPRGQERVRVRDAYGWPRCPYPIYIPLRALRIAARGGPTLLGTTPRRCRGHRSSAAR